MKYFKILICLIFLIFNSCAKTEDERQAISMKKDLEFKETLQYLRNTSGKFDMDYAKLFEGNTAPMRKLVLDVEMKYTSMGIHLLKYGKLTKDQEEIILLFFEPFPAWREWALEIVNEHDEKKKWAIQRDYDDLEYIGMSIIDAYAKDKTVRATKRSDPNFKFSYPYTTGAEREAIKAAQNAKNAQNAAQSANETN